MANEVYIVRGTDVLFSNDGTADVSIFNGVTTLANNTGRVSAQKDWGAAPRPERYSWICSGQWAATPTQGLPMELYIAEAEDDDNTVICGDVGTSDAALGDIDMRRNLRFIGSVVSENAAASEVCTNKGEFTSTARYWSLVVFDAAGATLNVSGLQFRFVVTPIWYQGQ